VDRVLREGIEANPRSPECTGPDPVPDPAIDLELEQPTGADTTSIVPDSAAADTTAPPRSADGDDLDQGAPPPSSSDLRPSAAAGDPVPGGVRFASFTRQYLNDEITQGVTGNIRTAMLRAQTIGTRDAAYRVEIHKKYAISFACIIFVLFGAPVALRFARGGIGMAIGVSVIVFALYWAGLIGGERLADRGRVNPMLAMWAPNLIFLLVSAPLLARMGTVMSTGRGGSGNGLRYSLERMAGWLRRGGRRERGEVLS
jgi:hypothetical protein